MSGSANFGFLKHHDPQLVELGADAERFFAQDPDVSIIRLRQLGEFLAQRAAAHAGMYLSDESQAELLRRLEQRNILPRDVAQHFRGLRMAGNVATHEVRGTHAEALLVLKVTRELAVWFHRTFGKGRAFKPGPFAPPADPVTAQRRDETRAAAQAAETEAVRAELATLRASFEAQSSEVEAARAMAEMAARDRMSAEERARREAEDHAAALALAEESEAQKAVIETERARLASEILALQEKGRAEPAKNVDEIIARARAAGKKVHLDEAATRALIDAQLREAGWEANTPVLSYGKGSRPQKGRNLAIAEWPTKSGEADYILFAGLIPVAVVEAKRETKDIAATIPQAKRYSRDLKITGEMSAPVGPWGDFVVPFLYSTNGRAYFRQLSTMSGIWFLDARRPQNHPAPLEGWHSPTGRGSCPER